MKEDPAPLRTKAAKLALSALLAVGLVPLMPTLVSRAVGLDVSWDQRLGSCAWSDSLSCALALSVHSLELSPAATELYYITAACAAVFQTALVCDLVGCRWPASWNTDNRVCYESMFSEPLRTRLASNRTGTVTPVASLVGHLGNTCSNLPYLWAGLVVLAAAPTSQFYCPDLVFGVMLVALAVFSFTWHASNAPKSHYADLWAMHSCIFYVLLRSGCVGVLHALCRWGGGRFFYVAENHTVVAAFCLAYYLRFIYQTGQAEWLNAELGTLDHGATFAGRYRLTHKGAPGNKDLRVDDVCILGVLPVFYIVIPTLVQCLAGSVGSALAATTMCASLSAGWSLRMFDRWVLDGWFPVNYAMARLGIACGKPSGPVSGPWVLVAAAVSPTACLHWFTGVTLFAFYVHVRTMDQVTAALAR